MISGSAVRTIGALCLTLGICLLAAQTAAAAGGDNFSWTGPTTVAQGVALRGISCPSETQCTAVGQNGTVVTFRLGSRSKPRQSKVDRGTNLTAVSCPTLKLCVAVDVKGDEVDFHPDAPKRSQLALSFDAPNQLNDVSCFSRPHRAPFCVAVDDEGLSVSFTTGRGSPSRQVIDAGQSLVAVACEPTGAECAAIDRSGHEVAINPSARTHSSVFAVDPGSILADVSCTSASQCTAVGEQPPTPQQLDMGGTGDGTRVTFDPAMPGTPTPVKDNVVLKALACPAISQCTTVGTAGGAQQYEETFDPRSSQSQPVYSPSTAEWGDISCPSVRVCVAVNLRGEAFVGFAGHHKKWSTAKCKKQYTQWRKSHTHPSGKQSAAELKLLKKHGCVLTG